MLVLKRRRRLRRKPNATVSTSWRLPNQKGFRRNPCFITAIRGSSRDSRKGTVCSDEASVFCYGDECGRPCKQLVARLDGYPQLALPVRTIKYLGIYRQEALLSARASRDRHRVRRTDGCSGESSCRLSSSKSLPTLHDRIVVRQCLKRSACLAILHHIFSRAESLASGPTPCTIPPPHSLCACDRIFALLRSKYRIVPQRYMTDRAMNTAPLSDL
jgi:hypothetical protein